jgi:prepilin signal peptidase PulO-like enzyme (type II secretory pathway)
MLQAIQNMPPAHILMAIIWTLALGFAVGNYACSLVHRLPRGRLILDKKPYCGSCGAELQVRDLFPVVSALMLKHRCRYCGTAFPVSHTWTEILVGLLFVLAFLQVGFSEQFLLIVTLGVFLITLAAIEANERMVMGKILLCVVVTGALWRTLQDHTIYGAFEGGFLALVAGAILWHKRIRRVGHIYTLPTPALLLTAGGLCVGIQRLPLFLALFAAIYVFDWFLRKLFRSLNPPRITLAFSIATMVPVLYPQLQAIVLQ